MILSVGKRLMLLAASPVSQGRGSNSSLLTIYKEASQEQKIRAVTHEGLRMLGANTPSKIAISPLDLQEAWEKVKDLEGMSKFILKDPRDFLSILAERMPPFDSRVQTKHKIEDVDEAIILECALALENKMLRVPFEGSSTPDSEIGKELLAERVKAGSFIFEDGCGNGENLIELVSNFRERGILLSALGTDIIFHNTNVGRMTTQLVGMDPYVSFSVGHALHRSSPRSISGREIPHLTLAYRVLPVFSPSKIIRYMKKISEEMRSGDLWCGSIALSEGKFYERYTKNQQDISKYAVRSLPTTFGEITFVHHPDFGESSDSESVTHFNRKFKSLKLNLKEEDFSTVVLNTYMTKETFEALAKRFDLKIVEARKVDCEDNARLVVILEKI